MVIFDRSLLMQNSVKKKNCFVSDCYVIFTISYLYQFLSKFNRSWKRVQQIVFKLMKSGMLLIIINFAQYLEMVCKLKTLNMYVLSHYLRCEGTIEMKIVFMYNSVV